MILEEPSSVAVSKIATPFRHPCANLSLALRLFLTAKGSKTWRSHGYHSYTRSETGAFLALGLSRLGYYYSTEDGF